MKFKLDENLDFRLGFLFFPPLDLGGQSFPGYR